MDRNTVGKGGIALFEQFLLFLQRFKNFVLQTRESQGLFWEGVHRPEKKAFEAIGNQHCLLFPQCFSKIFFKGKGHHLVNNSFYFCFSRLE